MDTEKLRTYCTIAAGGLILGLAAFLTLRGDIKPDWLQYATIGILTALGIYRK